MRKTTNLRIGTTSEADWLLSRARVTSVTDENFLIVETIHCLKLLNFPDSLRSDEAGSLLALRLPLAV